MLRIVPDGEGWDAIDWSRGSVINQVLPGVQAFLEQGTDIVFVVFDPEDSYSELAAPLIAGKAKEIRVLTISVVFLPFSPKENFEGLSAKEVLSEIERCSDSIFVMLPDASSGVGGNPLAEEGFQQGRDAVMSLVEAFVNLLDVRTDLNVDLEDVRYVLVNAGVALLGTSKASGPGRSARVIKETMEFEGNLSKELFGARRILISIMSGAEIEVEMEELLEITDAIQIKAGEEAEVIFGHGTDPSLGDNIQVTLVATGFPER